MNLKANQLSSVWQRLDQFIWWVQILRHRVAGQPPQLHLSKLQPLLD